MERFLRVDIIFKVNGENVQEYSDQKLATMLDREERASLLVVRPSTDILDLEKAIKQGECADVNRYLEIGYTDIDCCYFESSRNLNGLFTALMIASEEGKLDT